MTGRVCFRVTLEAKFVDEASAHPFSADPWPPAGEAESARFFAGLEGRADENARHLTQSSASKTTSPR